MDESNRDEDIRLFHAVEQSDGSYVDRVGNISWYNKHGEWHREDGPAVIYSNGEVEWMINGYNYTFAEWLIELNKPDEDKMLLRLQYV
jgi:hypothetical protein